MKLAIVGMGPGWNAILEDIESGEEFDEIWTINYYYELKGLTPDRVFDIHDLYFYRDTRDKVEKHKQHWDYLTGEKDFRFYGPLKYPEISGEVYPIWEVKKLLDNFKRKSDDGLQEIRMWTSSFDYLMSLAITEEPDEIHLYGWSMGWGMYRNDTEYQYQLPGLAGWTFYALGRGIKVFVDKNSPIFKARMYTYEGASVITRQTLETYKASFELELQQKQAEFHHIQGEFKSFVEVSNAKPNNEVYKNSMIKKQHELNDAMTKVVQAEAFLNLMRHLLDHIDTAEMNTEIESHLIKVVDGKVAEALMPTVEADE